MGNINDYLLWRGDIKIDKNYEFNEIDSMILARFSYLRFDKIKMNEKETIESISNKMKDLDNNEFLYNGDKELITNLGKSNRFKDMVVSNYVKNDDAETQKQFGAVTIHISDKELYASYIGTDSTINGWKEDFNMSFMDNVPCQIEGKEYLEKVAREYSRKKIRIGGHSKGGNVAVYSAITADKQIQNRIIKVYNYDGPGFSNEIINEYGKEEIINKVTTYLPQDSIIGRILNRKEKTIVAFSIQKGILQHDIFSWQVMGTELIKLEKNTDASENISETLTNWLQDTSTEQRKIFIDSIFELFYSTEATTFGDISSSLTTSVPAILKKYNEISKEDKKLITQMIKTFGKIYFAIVKEKESDKFSQIKEYYKEEGKKKLEEFDTKHFTRFKKNR